MISYGDLVKNKNNKEYIENFVKKLYKSTGTKKFVLNHFTKEELYSLLFDDVLGKFFKVYYENFILEFIFVFEKDALEIAYVLSNKKILEYCFGYFVANHGIIVEFLKKHPSASEYLLTDYNLSTFLTYNCFHHKPFLENLPSEFIHKNIGYISYILSHEFPRSKEQFLKEIENIPFCLTEVIAHWKCGERKELISFLNTYQKQYDVDLEPYKKEIIKILFSCEDMEDKENNPYLEVLEMILDEVLQVQNLTINDIEYKTYGRYSDIYQIGNFYLKLGDERYRYWIPSHKNVLRPIFRRYLEDIHLMVEIAPYVPILDKNNYVECQKLFNIFYEDEIILDDIKPKNIGKYRSISYEYFKNMYIANESIGFLGDNYEVPLEGEFVLADTDYLEYKETCRVNNCLSADLIHQYIKEYKCVKTVKKRGA